MTDIKLSDQLGAMAIIDELYQQQQVILEHLDQATLKAKVAQKVKEYYQAKGLAIDDEVINPGVKLWFDNRLTFHVPDTPWFQKLLATAYIKRYYWGSVVLAIVISIILVFVALGRINENRLTTLNLSIAAEYQQKQQLVSQLATSEKRYEQLGQQVVYYAKQPIAKLKSAVEEALNQESLGVLQAPSTPVKVVSLVQGQQLEQQLQQANASASQQLATVGDLLSRWQGLTAQDNRLNGLLLSDDFIQAAKRYQVLQAGAEQAKERLSEGQVIDLAKLESLYQQANSAQRVLNEVQAKVNQLKALNVPANDLKVVLSLQASIAEKISNLDFNAVKSYQDQLNYYVQLAKVPLTLKIVDKVGYKSGIERTYDSSGGKSWYLIVEATTASGDVYPLNVQSNESGVTKLVGMFGIRVAKREFDKVRQDKASDGHIDDAIVGKKPTGRLTFDYSRPVMDGTILEW